MQHPLTRPVPDNPSGPWAGEFVWRIPGRRSAWRSSLGMACGVACVRCLWRIGLTTDFGPVKNTCRLRWPDQRHFWMFQYAADFTGWVEIDVTTRQRTGRNEPLTRTSAKVCPPTDDRSAALWRTERYEGEVWGLTDRE